MHVELCARGNHTGVVLAGRGLGRGLKPSSRRRGRRKKRAQATRRQRRKVWKLPQQRKLRGRDGDNTTREKGWLPRGCGAAQMSAAQVLCLCRTGPSGLKGRKRATEGGRALWAQRPSGPQLSGDRIWAQAQARATRQLRLERVASTTHNKALSGSSTRASESSPMRQSILQHSPSLKYPAPPPPLPHTSLPHNITLPSSLSTT